MIRVEVRWWEDTRRACADDERYADLNLIVVTREDSRRAQVVDMIQGCLVCPVYYECLEDLLRLPRGDLYGIRAGIRGKT